MFQVPISAPTASRMKTALMADEMPPIGGVADLGRSVWPFLNATSAGDDGAREAARPGAGRRWRRSRTGRWSARSGRSGRRPGSARRGTTARRDRVLAPAARDGHRPSASRGHRAASRSRWPAPRCSAARMPRARASAMIAATTIARTHASSVPSPPPQIGSRTIGQVMQCPPPRPLPSSKPCDRDDLDAGLAHLRDRERVALVGDDDAGLERDDVVAVVPLLALLLVGVAAGLHDVELLDAERVRDAPTGGPCPRGTSSVPGFEPGPEADRPDPARRPAGRRSPCRGRAA